MPRKLDGTYIESGTITVTQLSGTLNETSNAAYNQANNAYAQANAARSDANTTFATVNTTFGTVNTAVTNAHNQANSARSDANTTFATINTSFGTVNTAVTNAHNQANSAFAAANGKLSLSGGTIVGDITVTGNLYVNGTETIVNTSSLTINDPIFLLANNNTTNAVGLGFTAHYGPTQQHTGLIRSHQDNNWYLFEDYNEHILYANNVLNLSLVKLATLRANVNANSLLLVGNTVATQANLTLAHNQANAAYGQANASGNFALSAYAQANAAYNQANSAFTAANNKVASVTGTSGRITSSGGTTPTIDLAAVGEVSGSYSSGISALTVDGYGRVTSVTGNANYTPTNGTGATGTWGISITGNAATVGGVGIANIVSGTNGAAASDAISNMNDLAQKSGFYLYNNPTNAPEATWNTWLTAMGHYPGDRYGWQITQAYWSDALWTRRLTNNSWQSWRKILDSGNYTSYAISSIVNNWVVTTDNIHRFYFASGGRTYYKSPNGHEFRKNTGDALTAVIDDSGNFSAIGNITAYSSDERLKTNIQNIPNALDKILSLNGVTFDWIDKVQELGFTPDTMINDAGVIAQEVQKVLPQAVKPAPFDREWDKVENKSLSKSGEEYITVQYEKLVPLLIEAIKELKAEIDELKKNN